MKKYLIPTLALFLLVFASCQKEKLETVNEQTPTDQVVTDGAVTTRSPAVPFNANYKTTVQVIGFDAGVITLNIDGKGKATHLGKSTMHSISSVNTNQYPWLQTGHMEMTAANGDQLFGTYAGTVFPTAEGVNFEGNYEITHGTGHFVGVTGSGTYYGAAINTSPNDAVGEISFNGTLSGL